MGIFQLLYEYHHDKINYVQLKDLLKNHRKDDLLAFILRANQQGAFLPFFNKKDNENS